LDFAGFDAVQAGDEFFEEAGFHGKSDKGSGIGYQGEVNGIRLVLCTFPDAASARQIGTVLVGKQLAACVNFIPGVESVYRWEGRVESASEVLAIFKTSRAAWPELERALAGLHPYQVPEIVALEPAAVAVSYQAWLLGEVAGFTGHGA
jgi:periplasmic divalent cation tolerance protein